MSGPLKRGSRGTAIKELTELLVAQEFLEKTSSTYNLKVQRAVEAFQARNLGPNGRPLVVDGIAGPLTLWSLKHPINRNLPPPPSTTPSIPAGGNRVGRAALRVALAEMRAGAREIGGNNRGPFVQKYLNNILNPPQNWCAAFVSWCFSESGHPMPYTYSLGARDIRQKFQRKGWAFDARTERPKPGDIVVWWRGQPQSWQGHIGFVFKLEHGILYTIEGNKGAVPAPVQSFDYVLSRMDRVLGFGRVGGI